jgi:hypothetical protein
MRVSIRNYVAAIGLAALSVFALPSAARAAIIVEFDDLGVSGGTLTQSGTVITGTNILIDIITLQDDVSSTTLSTAQCGLTDTPGTVCLLNFEFDTATDTGTISIVSQAGVYGSGADQDPFTGDDGPLIVAGVADILRGTLTAGGFATSTTFGAEGTDTKNEALLDYFNIVVIGDFDLSATTIRISSEDSTVRDADVINSGEIILIPEPGMLGLFGLGLLGVGNRLRRRRVN